VKTLSRHLDDYLRLRRQLGYKLQEAGILLRNFVRFAEQEGAEYISTKLTLRWATGPNITPALSGSRLGLVRRFAAYVSAHDVRTEVPAQKLLPYHFLRRDPYHYSDENVLQLINAARQIDPSQAAHLFVHMTARRCGPARPQPPGPGEQSSPSPPRNNTRFRPLDKICGVQGRKPL